MLLLDPHESWSRSQGHLAGGPLWDVVENHQSPELINHLETFARFEFNPEEELKQTFIRIPLRTAHQASTSKIRPGKQVTATSIRHALERFSQDIKGGDLLFLKHIRKVIIRADDEILLSSEIFAPDAQAKSIHDGLPSDFLHMYKAFGPKVSTEVSRIFQTSITHVDGSGASTDEYVISHLMKPSSNHLDLDAWGRGLKLLPWVAVAAPLRVQGVPFQGKLFSTLSLHLRTLQPVHIHGLFAIGPDRARLGFDDLEVRWNRYMFEVCVTDAWSRLLEFRKSKSPTAERFSFWPKNELLYKPEDPWTALGIWIVDLALREYKILWNTTGGYCVPFEEALFTASKDDGARYQESWAGIRLPGVILEPSLLELLKARAKNQSLSPTMLSPHSVRTYLRKDIPIPDRHIDFVLEYCLLDIIRNNYTRDTLWTACHDLCSIRLWRMLNGNLDNIPRSRPALLPRDDSELQLFKRCRPDSTLAMDKFTPKVQVVMSGTILHTNTIARFRRLKDLEADWPNLFQPTTSSTSNADIGLRDVADDPLFRNIWTWILARFAQEQQKIPASLDNLWLLPLRGERVRRLNPVHNNTPALIIENDDWLNDVILDPTLQDPIARAAIVDSNVLGNETTLALRNFSYRIPDMRLAHSEDLHSLVDWLVSAEDVLQKASLEQKKLILDHLAALVPFRQSQQLSSVAKQIARLPLFTRSIASWPFSAWETTRARISQAKEIYVIPKDLPALPEMDGLAFYNLSDNSERHIAQELNLIHGIAPETLLDRYFLPWLSADLDASLQRARMCLVDWIFQHSKTPTQAWKVLVSSRPIVPTCLKNGVQRSAILTNLVDPESQYANLYYEDEDVFPSRDFFEKHKLAARICGLKNGSEESTFPLDRAKVYAQHSADDQLIDKVSCLLTLALPYGMSDGSVNYLRNLKWFPARSPQGGLQMYAPRQCRGAAHHYLVDNVWGSTDLHVSLQWQAMLGWDQDVPQDVLLAQLERCVTQCDITKINKLLAHFKPSQLSALAKVPCVLGSSGKFMLPTEVYRPGDALISARMTPYIDRVEPTFASSHSDLLSAIGVRTEPSVEDLRAVQIAISTSVQGILDRNGLEVAIASLEAACYLGYNPNQLRIPDASGVLRDLADVVQGEVVNTGKMAQFNLTHATISMDLLRRLRIETAYERATRLNLEIEDDDDDEYAPREKLTNIISDTLGRYPIETTFNEFLANADDAGAQQVCWTIDKCLEGPYASSCLLTPELKPFQGPSLIVYNNSVFSDKDFAGFKEIGQGGKQDDATTTGMFGRGAMTMYHFTDVPMLVSGSYFLIIDPQQERLSRNLKTWKRRLGIKIPLSRIRQFAGDSLEPFDGMHGYNVELDYFEGTIFRFPFRERASITDLRDSIFHPDALQTEILLNQYFEIARSTLLFLHSVNSIEVRVRGELAPKWSVSAARPGLLETDVFGSIIISSLEEDKKPRYDLWRIGLKDIESSPPHIQKIGKGSSKITECGIAACLRYDQADKPGLESSAIEVTATTSRDMKLQHRVFCMLPTSSASQLPISFHASFAITGDRKTIAFENQDPLAAWNRWLLSECVADFYVEFLRDAARRYGPEVFHFWPRKPPSREVSLSATVAESFWTKLMNEVHFYDQLYPVLSTEKPIDGAETTNLRRPMTRQRRALHDVTTLEKAHFDFLAYSDSAELRPLFHKLSLNIVRPPPAISRQLKNVAKNVELTELGPKSLSRLFSEDATVKALEQYLATMETEEARTAFYGVFLRCIVPQIVNSDPTSLHILQDCRVIPRPQMNLPLGVLRFNATKDSVNHLKPNLQERKLFMFACDWFVNVEIFKASGNYGDVPSSVTRDPITDMITAGANIRAIEIEDIGVLLSRHDSPTNNWSPTKEHDQWLESLWLYLNGRWCGMSEVANTNEVPSVINTEKFLTKAGLWDQPIFRAVIAQSVRYISPRAFMTGAYLVEPDIAQHRELCINVPGLGLVSRLCVPFTLAECEGNLDLTPSFIRFVLALTRGGQASTPSIKFALNYGLNDTLRSTLRALLAKYLINFRLSSDVREPDLLRCLPVWPRFQRPEHVESLTHIAADEARFCAHQSLFVDWVDDLKQFVDPKVVSEHTSSLPKLGVHLMTVKEMWEVIKKDLPAKITGASDEQQHLRLLKQLSKSGIKTKQAIAPNGLGTLCLIESLYDHEENIFVNVFSEEKSTRFLHPTFHFLRTFFTDNGLKTRGRGQLLKEQHFIECALAVDRQWRSDISSAAYDRSASVVSAYLYLEKEDFRDWSQSSWLRISKLRLFLVKRHILDHPNYRQSRMQIVAEKQHHSSLNDAARDADVRICWSQCAFLENPPAPFVFSQRQMGIGPSLNIVYEHLKFLVSLHQNITQTDVAEYLIDLQACYSQLQACVRQTLGLPGIRSAKIWFNLDSTERNKILKDQLALRLLPSHLLCLDAPCKYHTLCPNRLITNMHQAIPPQ